MRVLNEFKEFAVKGNVIDMAVGILIGAAFATVINSMVKDIISPVIGLATSNVNFSDVFIVLREGITGGPYATLAEARSDAAVTMNIGSFVDAFISFSIIAFILFFIVKSTNKLKRPKTVTADPTNKKECPFCFSIINIKAKRCPLCTAELDADN